MLAQGIGLGHICAWSVPEMVVMFVARDAPIYNHSGSCGSIMCWGRAVGVSGAFPVLARPLLMRLE